MENKQSISEMSEKLTDDPVATQAMETNLGGEKTVLLCRAVSALTEQQKPQYGSKGRSLSLPGAEDDECTDSMEVRLPEDGQSTYIFRDFFNILHCIKIQSFNNRPKTKRVTAYVASPPLLPSSIPWI